MLKGVALAYSALPLVLIEERGLGRRVACRGGEPEVRFLWSDHARVLPVWHEDRQKLVAWGNQRGESRTLPCTGWTWLRSVEDGKWRPWKPVEVDVPATMLLDGDIWYCVRQGFRALLVHDEKGAERVFGIAEEASYYYRIMSRGKWMPLLIGERI
jgi:hypothetical protein